MGEIIKPDGTKIKVYPENGKDFTVQELRTHIGGGHLDFRTIYNSDGSFREHMVVDDEGHEKEQSRNQVAALRSGYPVIVGDALFCTRAEIV